MYAIEEGLKKINGAEVDTFRREVVDGHACLEVEAGTTGYKGGNRRMAMRCCRSFKTVAEIQPVLDFLDDYGYIIRKPDKAVASGRPPLPKYAVNPAVLS